MYNLRVFCVFVSLSLRRDCRLWRRSGSLWKPLCYSVATFITLLLVPVFYSIFVLDLKLVRWEGPTERE